MDWMNLYNQTVLALRKAGEPLPPYLASLSSKELKELRDKWDGREDSIIKK